MMMSKYLSKKVWFLGGLFFVSVCVYFYFVSHSKNSSLFRSIPIVFLPDSPWGYVEAQIEGERYLLEIDTGCCEEFSLREEVLSTLKNKDFFRTANWMDVNGNRYSSDCFVLPLLTIGKVDFTNIGAMEETIDFMLGGSALDPKMPITPMRLMQAQKTSGRIGTGIFRVCDYWLLDFPNHRLIPIKNLEKLIDESVFSVDGFIQGALDPESKHFVISIQTDFGVKRFALDTGAQVSTLNIDREGEGPIRTRALVIGGFDFGEMELYPANLPEVFHFDGFLGLDFIAKHPIYLDFKKNRIFIGPAAA